MNSCHKVKRWSLSLWISGCSLDLDAIIINIKKLIVVALLGARNKCRANQDSEKMNTIFSSIYLYVLLDAAKKFRRG